MLVTFSCDAHENITMFGDVAIRLIKMTGHSGAVPSAIVSEDVPSALAHLKQAIALEKQKPMSVKKETEDDDEEVSLVNRAIPLIELLEAAVKEKCDVIWK